MSIKGVDSCGPTLPWGLLAFIDCWGVGIIFFGVVATCDLPLLWDITHTHAQAGN